MPTRYAFVTALAMLGAAYVLVTIGRYLAASPGVERHHVESAVVAFVILAVIARVGRRLEPPPMAAAHDRVAAPFWALFGVAALALYWVALEVGFLADDHVLVPRAAAWDLSAASPVLFRPVPLFLWGLLSLAGAGASVFHLLNILLHATNAWLLARVLAGWGAGRPWSLAGGGLFLTLPVLVEPVIWCSGVFDLVATTAVLVAVLVAHRWQDAGRLAGWNRLALAIALLAALLSKESAVAAPLLVWFAARARGRVPAALARDLLVALVIMAGYGLYRALDSFGPIAPPLSRYAVQRALFSSVGSLALPFHADIIATMTWLPTLTSILLVVLALRMAIGRLGVSHAKLLGTGVLWLLVAVLPVYPVMPVPADLQGSRYLYLPAVGWTTVAVAMLASMFAAGRRWERAAWATLGVFITAGAIAVWVHAVRWREAGATRDLVVAAAAADPALGACSGVRLEGLPDTIDGAYLFRNGVEPLLGRDADVRVVQQPDDAACVFRWDHRQRRFVRP